MARAIAGGRGSAGRMGLLARAAVLLGLLAVPTAACADDLRFGEYVSLGQLERTPAPLVPIKLPSGLENGQGVGTNLLYGQRGSVYELAYRHITGIETPNQHVDENLVLADHGAVGLAAARRALGPTFATSPTRVRGRRGYALRQRFSTVRGLMWAEDGHVYELSTGTPRKVRMGDLRATAASLQHLLGSFVASLSSPGDAEAGGVLAVVADRAVLVNVEWNATCTMPGSEFTAPRSGAVTVGWIPLAGGTFAQPTFGAPSGGPGPPWSGTLTGSATAAGGTVTVGASVTLGSESCSTGTISAPLVRLPKLVKAS
jgi:hypothetical protein